MARPTLAGSPLQGGRWRIPDRRLGDTLSDGAASTEQDAGSKERNFWFEAVSSPRQALTWETLSSPQRVVLIGRLSNPSFVDEAWDSGDCQ